MKKEAKKEQLILRKKKKRERETSKISGNKCFLQTIFCKDYPLNI
jgi:hypothetical protein